MEFSENVIDIREQYPLFPLQETLLITKELGIQHPKHPKTQEPIVMTTDFLITIKDAEAEVRDIVRTFKYKKELLKKRVLEKFEIEVNTGKLQEGHS
ncbi:TnsA endonuclease N-terminal domain-containing protein [Sporanaerobium hydrogeniformans]|uniref:TnsA endonuclease N-terminal domain-containing protein n=1 Tax=Sporanaerobium hydrogeniformans TaxID=3072179 RepID=UPI0015D50144|nr:TnsA endonuclease N-terminal domain-containing protein [Sporanaerobium hydrogeniformans]